MRTTETPFWVKGYEQNLTEDLLRVSRADFLSFPPDSPLEGSNGLHVWEIDFKTLLPRIITQSKGEPKQHLQSVTCTNQGEAGGELKLPQPCLNQGTSTEIVIRARLLLPLAPTETGCPM